MKRVKTTFWVTAGLLSVFLVVTLPPDGQNELRIGLTSVFEPLLTGTTSTLNAIGNQTKGIFAYRNLVKENKYLRQQRAELKRKLVKLQEVSRENQRLRGLLSFKEQAPYSLIPARVIGRDSSAWFSSLLIDRGTDAGLRPEMPVISSEGVVGRVVSVGPRFSRVMLISDNNSRLSVLIQDSREEIVAAGEGLNLIRLKYLSHNPQLKTGALVITSGLDGIFPKGLLVGHVLRIQTEPHNLIRTGLLKPSADLFKLEEVLCLDTKKGL